MAKQLVVFYSRKGENHFPGGIRSVEKGNTAYAAEFIQDALQSDIFEIDTVGAFGNTDTGFTLSSCGTVIKSVSVTYLHYA